MDDIKVFINERAVFAPAGGRIGDVLAGLDADLAAALRTGRAYVTDGVGRRVDPATAVRPGAIFRIVRGAPRAPDERA